jgi:hypothetical protein
MSFVWSHRRWCSVYNQDAIWGYWGYACPISVAGIFFFLLGNQSFAYFQKKTNVNKCTTAASTAAICFWELHDRSYLQFNVQRNYAEYWFSVGEWASEHFCTALTLSDILFCTAVHALLALCFYMTLELYDMAQQYLTSLHIYWPEVEFVALPNKPYALSTSSILCPLAKLSYHGC